MLVIGDCLVLISNERPATLTEILRGFPQSFEKIYIFQVNIYAITDRYRDFDRESVVECFAK